MPCSDTFPSFHASLIARFPLLAFFLLVLLMLAIAVPAFVVPGWRPVLNSDFEALQVKDHPATAAKAAVETLDALQRPFWASDTDTLEQLSGGTPPDEAGLGDRRRLMSLPPLLLQAGARALQILTCTFGLADAIVPKLAVAFLASPCACHALH